DLFSAGGSFQQSASAAAVCAIRWFARRVPGRVVRRRAAAVGLSEAARRGRDLAVAGVEELSVQPVYVSWLRNSGFSAGRSALRVESGSRQRKSRARRGGV